MNKDEQESINFLSSIFYCMIPNEKAKNSRKKVSGIDKKNA
jgi:hypothetical protein